MKKNRKLIEAREKAGFTQRELAKLIGCHYVSLYRIECGMRRGSMEFWRKVKGALGLSAEEAFSMFEGDEK